MPDAQAVRAADRLPIGLLAVFEVGPSSFEQAGRGEAFIGEYESRGNR